MVTEVIGISDEYVDEVYDLLRKMEVDIDSDPIIHGPKRLQNKIAEARNMLTITQRLIVDLSHKVHLVKRALRTVETDIEIKTSNLLTNDPDVKQCKSLKDREAMASTKMVDEIRNRIKYSSMLFELETVLSVVKLREKDMRDILSRIRDQIKLCQDEISLGSKWGKIDEDDDKDRNLINDIDSFIDNNKSKGGFKDVVDDDVVIYSLKSVKRRDENNQTSPKLGGLKIKRINQDIDKMDDSLGKISDLEFFRS